MIKILQYRAEFYGLKLFFGILKLFPIEFASKMGGIIGKIIGPRLNSNITAINNFTKAFPEQNENEINQNLIKMWDNFGRTLAEYPFLHIFRYENDRVTIEGEENLKKCDGNSSIIFSGHFANWEVMATVIASLSDLVLVYRAPNNPLVDNIIRKYRKAISLNQVRKGPQGAKELINFIKKGTNLGMLVDQKQNDGLPIQFFGREAMTPTAIARLSLKYKLRLIPVSIERKSGPRFHIKIHKRLEVNLEKDDTFTIMKKINEFLEVSIQKNPSQWLWMHKRWN
ncbi:MAG: Lipid A biosynthesis lauroyltransferase [Alphaproteobacteria bacterium MarineAlpha2_Bin1]|nr:MAG: Lipid A biosynthesis lauroyltransferase [Alphaproteobacteria bacterium MarineAlpha2_Bin1]